MSKYQGFPFRTEQGGFLVEKDGKVLSPFKSQKVHDHSPNGFNWGYGGSGPAQLALALLLEETDKDTAISLYHTFKGEMIAKLEVGNGWTLFSEEIQDWLAKAVTRKGGPNHQEKE